MIPKLFIRTLLMAGILCLTVNACMAPNDDKVERIDVPMDDTVLLELALQNIRNYNLWWAMTPDSMWFDSVTSTIHFDSVKVSNETIREYFMMHNRATSGRKAPFYDTKGPAKAHVVRMEELKSAMGIRHLDSKFDGLRFYNGTSLPHLSYPEDPKKYLNHVYTKLYFVPVIREIVGGDTVYRDILPNDSDIDYVYDLTMPCPNSCDVKSKLYHATQIE